MSTEIILGVLFFFIIIAFLGGMFFLPQLFGISKSEEQDAPAKDEKVEK